MNPVERAVTKAMQEAQTEARATVKRLEVGHGTRAEHLERETADAFVRALAREGYEVREITR